MAQAFKTVAHTLTGVDPAMNPALAEIERRTGPNNLLRMMANRPQAMEDFERLYAGVMLSPGTIDQRLREMLALAVASVNECDYCVARHMQGARKVGLTEREIGEIQTEQNQHFTPREQMALMYARELTREASVDGDMRHRLVELFTVEQCVELTMIVSLANFDNRFCNALHVTPE